jgi:hypothetical protein
MLKVLLNNFPVVGIDTLANRIRLKQERIVPADPNWLDIKQQLLSAPQNVQDQFHDAQLP